MIGVKHAVTSDAQLFAHGCSCSENVTLSSLLSVILTHYSIREYSLFSECGTFGGHNTLHWYGEATKTLALLREGLYNQLLPGTNFHHCTTY